MSYSFGITAPTKAEAKEKVRVSMANVVATQPVHSADEKQVVESAHRFIDILPEPKEGQHVVVSMNGYVTWAGVLGADENPVIVSISSTCSAYLANSKA